MEVVKALHWILHLSFPFSDCTASSYHFRSKYDAFVVRFVLWKRRVGVIAQLGPILELERRLGDRRDDSERKWDGVP